MIRASIVFVALCLPMLQACSHDPVVPSPPQVIEVVKPAPVPPACRVLQPVVIGAGASAEQVLSAQHAALLAYESQVTACAH